MKRFLSIFVLSMFVCVGYSYAWFPAWIQNNQNYQGSNSVLNVASGTIRVINATDITTTGIITKVPQYVVISSSKTQIIPTSSFVMLQSTGVNWFLDGYTVPISTVGYSAGDFIILTTTNTNTIAFPTSVVNYVLCESSPITIGQYDTLGLMFTGSYWISVSSKNN
jgi:hypothetical protein